MGIFLQWWDGLGRATQLEMWKIVIDKGLFAFLIALAAYLFARRQEKARAVEVRRLELEKLTIPRVHNLMERTDAFWREGREVIAKLKLALDDQWMPWVSEVISHTSTPTKRISSMTGEEILGCPLRNGLTIREHFVVLARDHEMKKRLRSVVPTGEHPFLKDVLRLYEFPGHEMTDTFKECARSNFARDFYRDLTRDERNAFARRTEDFLMEAKNVLPLSKPRVVKGVKMGADTIRAAVVEFPANTPEIDLLSDGHLAIASQLHEAISPRPWSSLRMVRRALHLDI